MIELIVGDKVTIPPSRTIRTVLATKRDTFNVGGEQQVVQLTKELGRFWIRSAHCVLTDVYALSVEPQEGNK